MAPFGTASPVIVLDDDATLEPVLLERTLRDRSPELRAAVGIAVGAAFGAALLVAHALPVSTGEISHRTQGAATVLPATQRGKAARPNRARRIRKPAAAKSTRTPRREESSARPPSPTPPPPLSPPTVTVVRAPVAPSRPLATPQVPPPTSSPSAGEFF